ncbi:hypothetical protein, partial [Escherichia coli]|uniref:hypothetical protein n=1 Tax=Escherichia coli TaxID=562 RepID=UPI00398B720A
MSAAAARQLGLVAELGEDDAALERAADAMLDALFHAAPLAQQHTKALLGELAKGREPQHDIRAALSRPEAVE